jgi:hypothetical protein
MISKKTLTAMITTPPAIAIEKSVSSSLIPKKCNITDDTIATSIPTITRHAMLSAGTDFTIARPTRKTTAAIPTAKMVEYGPLPINDGMALLDELSGARTGGEILSGIRTGGEIFGILGGGAALMQPVDVHV